MKFFTKRVQEKQKVDPRSQKFVDSIQEMLKEHGITNQRALDECSHLLLKTALKFFKSVNLETEDYNDEEVGKLENKFREILTKYDIVEEEEQDLFFIGFFSVLNELGAEGLKE